MAPGALLGMMWLAGCEAPPPHELAWDLELADEAVRARGVTISVQITAKPCAEACGPDRACSRYAAVLPLDPEGASRVPDGGTPPPTLESGAYGFHVELLDDACQVIASGCTDARLPRSRVTVTLVPAPVGICACPATECVAGFCPAGPRPSCPCIPPPTETRCGNADDDDCDGAIDCDDPDCVEQRCLDRHVCRGGECVLAHEENCDDGRDEDHDGPSDCRDTEDCPPFAFCNGMRNKMCCGMECRFINRNDRCGLCGLSCGAGTECRRHGETGIYGCSDCERDGQCPGGWVCGGGGWCECQTDGDCCGTNGDCRERWHCDTTRDNRHCL